MAGREDVAAAMFEAQRREWEAARAQLNRMYETGGPPVPQQPQPEPSAAQRLADTLSYYAGPHLSQVGRNMAQAFMTLAPGSGTVQSVQDYGDARDNVRAGNYGQAAIDTARGVVGQVADWVPAMKLAMAALPLKGLRPTTTLPMDEASRMARAKEMGFYTEIPLYHGTATEFPAFSREPPARNSQGPLAQTAISTTRDPAYASDFAALSADRGTGSSPQVLPLLHRAENPARIDATGLTQREIAGAVQDAWEAGHDAVLVQNYTMGAFNEVPPTDHIMIRNPNQLRSRFAVFDPAKRDSADLLAGMGGVALFGATAPYLMQDPSQ